MTTDWEQSHRGKVPYLTRRAAKRVASRLRRLNIDRGLQPYRCRHCPFWHLGHGQGQATGLRNKGPQHRRWWEQEAS